ncbi:2TM domain-containing protein [Chloroflexota bacterium]
MSNRMSEEEIYKASRKRVEEKKGFFIHLATYIIVNLFLIALWFFTTRGSGYPWFIWTLGGWGIGLIFHFLGVFVFLRHSNWEQREIEKEAERLRKDQGGT